MQKILLLLSIILSLTACTSNYAPPPQKSTLTKPSENIPTVDHQTPFQANTDTFDYDKKEHLIAFLKKRSENQNKPYCFQQKNEFQVTSFSHIPPIPIPVYERVFARNKSLKTEKNANSKRLYGINELEQHIQLILAKDGKYFPYLQLFTLSKPDLNIMDSITIFHSFADAGEIDITLGCLSEDFKQLKIWDIHNSTTKSNWELADTLELHYRITDTGEIKKLSEKLP